MNMHASPYPGSSIRGPTPGELAEGGPGGDPRALLRALWSLVAGLSLMYLYALLDTDPVDVAWAFLISGVALLPGYLWCTGRAHGVPVLPLFAASHIWAFAFPLVANHPGVLDFNVEQHSVGSLTVIGFLLFATAVWYQFVSSSRVRARPGVRMAFSSNTGDWLFVVMLAASSVFTLVVYGDWIDLGADIMSSLRGIILGLGSLGIYVLAYRWGGGVLARKNVRWFVLLLVAFMIINATSTLLVGSMTSFLLALIGYSVGKREVPWGVFGVGILLFMFLHVGKGEVRDYYRDDVDGIGRLATPFEYPAFFAQWTKGSLDKLSGKSDQDAGQSLLQRASLMHILLMVQQDSPDPIPFMQGVTYKHIPQQLIPRIFAPGKVSSHEGTVLLNLHYELQTSREDTTATSIGWGLLSEAYANFGYWGVGMLAVFLGCTFGALSRWGINSPVLSFRFLCNLLVLALCFNTEISMGAFLASLYQSFLALVGVSYLLMKPVRINA
jgi:hypothetical protein